MEALDKLAHVASETGLEADAETGSNRVQACGHSPAELRRRYNDSAGGWVKLDGRSIPIHRAAAPGGKRVPLLKAMLTTACERDCYYCPFRAGRKGRRVSFKPEEMATVFHAVHHAGHVEGLFLSTGILRGGASTQDRLLDTADILRNRLGYRGYLHLKIMPGAERDQVLRAMQLADRVSINLEAPNPERLAHLAPNKRFADELLEPLRWAQAFRRSLPPPSAGSGRLASTTTQFVVGAAGESDLEILSTTYRLYREMGLSRAYYEAFRPIEDTPLENHPAEEPLREQRLYQASFLLRDYGFDLEELPFRPTGNLPLEEDPKLGYARERLAEAPVEVNRAERAELIRVPGIGPRAAAAILQARQASRLNDLSALRKLRVDARRAAPFITLDGKRPPAQLPLFELTPA